MVVWDAAGLVVRGRFRGPFTIAYGEILTAERPRSRRGLRLHVRTMEPVHLRAESAERPWVEGELRRRGVRIVDCWGAIIAPSLVDFEAELAREPMRLRQSSDDA